MYSICSSERARKLAMYLSSVSIPLQCPSLNHCATNHPWPRQQARMVPLKMDQFREQSPLVLFTESDALSRSQPDELADTKALSLTRVEKGTMTIILVGETGVGKTAFMSLLANVCAGRQIDDFRLEHNTANESHLSKNQSQTNTAMMYTFKRRDGCTLRILDTPGLCDTRGLEQDKKHKKSIAETIKAQVQTLDGVIIMANGTLERVGPGVEYALHTLSTMFPRSIVNNIGFMFTNVPDALSFNFQSSTLPEELRNAERWTIQNPVAQFVKYQEAKSSNSRRPQSEQQLRALQRLLHSNFAITLETLNDFFAWLDTRKAQPTSTIVQLYEMTTRIEAAISNVLAQIDQRERQRMDLQRLQANLDKSNQVCLTDVSYD
jgi:GTP-binding protein EngB required for normal cell division